MAFLGVPFQCFFFNQVGGVVGWLSIKDPEEGVGAPQVFLDVFLSIFFFFVYVYFL